MLLRLVVRFLKLLVPVFLIAFLLRSIINDSDQIASYWANFKPIPLIISFLILLTIYPQAALSWHIILRKLGVNVTVKESLPVWILSTTSRYIPGSIWQYIGRVELSQRNFGLKRNIAVVSLLLEIFLGVTAAVVVGIFGLPILFQKNVDNLFWIFLIPIPLLLFHPSISSMVISLLAKFLKRKIDWDLKKLDTRKTIEIIPWYIFNFLLNGVALYFLILAFNYDFGFRNILQLAGIYALSWVVGFIAVFAPAGVGVTEATLSYFLAFNMPFPLASLVALSYRFFLTFAEIAVFIFSLKLWSKNEK